jgi:hypothetical protein
MDVLQNGTKSYWHQNNNFYLYIDPISDGWVRIKKRDRSNKQDTFMSFSPDEIEFVQDAFKRMIEQKESE